MDNIMDAIQSSVFPLKDGREILNRERTCSIIIKLEDILFQLS